jgi:hypothetical protein
MAISLSMLVIIAPLQSGVRKVFLLRGRKPAHHQDLNLIVRGHYPPSNGFPKQN